VKFTNIGTDYISVNENDLKNNEILNQKKIHLIKLNLKSQTKESITAAVSLFPNTNRFVVPSNANIKIFNDAFKAIGKKFYIENEKGSKLISFFKKNNKVLLNVDNLAPHEKEFVMNKSTISDIMWNCEVIQMSKKDYTPPIAEQFSNWNGNLILV